MRIFLSYPAEYRNLAERLTLALRGEGHRVFFDRSDLPPGEGYNQPIRSAIAASELLIFLITPESVADGSYTRTELQMAQAKWPHPGGRVLPVRVAPTDIEQVPPYLREVSTYTPEGDVVAEITGLVADVQRRRRDIRRRPGVVPALAVLAVLVVVAAALAIRSYTQRGLDLSDVTLSRIAVGVASVPDQYELRAWVRNRASRALPLDALQLEVSDDSLRTVWVESPAADELPPMSIPAGSRRPVHVRGAVVRANDSLPPPAAQLQAVQWRACWTSGEARRCEEWRPWPQFEGARAEVRLDAGLRARARFVASTRGGYVLALADPDQLLPLSPDGTQRGDPVPLAGEPSALAATEDLVVVGTHAPGVVQLFEAATLRPMSTHRIPEGEILGTRASTRVFSLAVTGEAVWVITGGNGDGAAAIRALSRRAGLWQEIPYGDDPFAFDPRGVRLHAGRGEEVWGVTTATTPSSLYRLTPSAVQEFGGHREEHISCARDLAVLPDGGLVVPGCESGLLALRPRAGELPIERRLRGDLVPAQGAWEDEWVVLTRDAVVVGVTVLRDDPVTGRRVAGRTRVTSLPLSGGPGTILLDLPEVALESLAVDGASVMAVVRDAVGAFDLIQLR